MTKSRGCAWVQAARCLRPRGTEWDALLVLAKTTAGIDALSLESRASGCIPHDDHANHAMHDPCLGFSVGISSPPALTLAEEKWREKHRYPKRQICTYQSGS